MPNQLINITGAIPNEFFIFVHFSTPETARSLSVHNGFISPSCEMWSHPEMLEKYKKNIIDNLPLVENEKIDIKRYSPFLASKIKDYLIEVEIERFRLEHYPHCPSRLTSIFAFGDVDTCNNVIALHNWQRQSLRKFQLIDNEHNRVAKVNMSIVSYVSSFYNAIPKDIRGKFWDLYWSGKHSVLDLGNNVPPFPKDIIWEYLIEGQVTISG